MGKRKNKEMSSYDLVSSISDVYGTKNSRTNQSCSRQRITRQKAKEAGYFIFTEPWFSTAVPCRERTKRDDSTKKSISNEPQKLDSNIFECYLEHLWRNLLEDKKTSFTYLDCLWYALYRKKDTRAKVLTWVKNKHIFSRKYVFVPIVCWNHWSLLILCNFGESFDSKTNTPCMLLLDSLEMTNPKRLEPDIRKFVFDIYKEEGRTENKKSIAKIPFLVPKVPQQKNAEDCGIFVLYFINLFLECAPENFNSFEEFLQFMNENLVSAKGLEFFCKEVRKFWRKMKKPAQQWGKRCLDKCNSSIMPIAV